MYTYTKLRDPTATFRLFCLHPGIGRAPLRGELVQRGVDEGEIYDSISYRCEELDRYNMHHITIDDALFRTSRTVQEALFRLRHTDRPRQLWIDQICIDQGTEPDSLRERGQQVKIMGRIYRNSHETIIWLGIDLTSAERAGMGIIRSFDQLHKQLVAAAAAQLASIRARQSEAERRTGTTIVRTADLELLFGLTALLTRKSPTELVAEGVTAAADLPELAHSNNLHIIEFYKRAYFCRMWPVQEIILSKRKIIYCGDDTTDWNLVGWFASWFLHQCHDSELKQDEQLRGLEAVMWVYSYAQTYSTGFPLATMLRTARRFDAKDLKDKVFALLGIVDFNLSHTGTRYDSSGDQVVSAVPDELDPDYNKDTPAVYFDVARYMLRKDKNLIVISAVELPLTDSPHASSRGPSWVPRWDVREQVEHIWLPHATAENFSACTLDDPAIRCWRQVHNSQAYFMCAVRGVKAAGVARVAPYDPKLAPSAISSDKTWLRIASLAAEMVHWATSAGSRAIDDRLAADIALVLTAGRAEAGQIVTPAGTSATTKTIPQHTADFADLMMDVDESGAVLEGKHLQDAFRTMVQYLAAQRFARSGNTKQGSYAQRCHSATRGKTAFLTDSGMLGLGPAGMEGVKADDEVLVLAGGRVPLLTRPTPVVVAANGRCLLGECYLRGAMDREYEGEVMRRGEEYVLV